MPNIFDQFDAPPQTSTAAQPKANVFDQFDTQPQDAPASATAPAHFNPRGAPASEAPSADQADKLAYAKDMGRQVAQDALFNYGDEAIAGVRSLYGEDYAKALQDEREQLKAAQGRLGAGSRVASVGLSMMMPMGPVARGIQRLAGPGAGFLRTGAAAIAAAAPIAGTAAVGEMDDKSDLGKDAETFGKGAATGGITAGLLHTTAVPIVKGAQKVGEYVGDVVNRGRELVNRGNPVPLTSTTNYALGRMADEAEKGGARTPQEFAQGLTDNAVPDTPSAAVNAGNDRLTALAANSASKLQDPNIPRLVNSQREDGNVFRAMQDAQSVTGQGQTQGQAFRDRLFDSTGVPDWERDLPDVQQHDQNRLQFGSQQLQDLERPQNGAPYNSGQIPGFTQALEDPDFANQYRAASRAIVKPGSPDSIAPHAVPLLPEDYNAAYDNHLANGGPAPVALTDNNVPMQILSLMRRNISASTQGDGRPVDQEISRRMLAMYDHLTNGSGPNGAVRDLNDINRNMHGIHNRGEDIRSGYGMPSQTGPTRAAAIADARMLPAARQNDVGLGLVHGVADASKANNENLGKLADDIFANPDFQQAFDHFSSGRSPHTFVPSEEIRGDLDNVGNMQQIGDLLSNVSSARTVNPESLPAEAARTAVKFHISPSFGTAWFLSKWLKGDTQARHGEIARLLTDTSGEGVRRLSEELGRRIAQRNALPPVSRILVVNEIAKQLGQAAPQLGQSQ